MKLNLMREFVKLAENQNFTKTAEELYVAQSVLSRHIVSIEEELHVKLINRSRNSFELTAEGRIVQEEFKKILEMYGNMLDRLSHLDAEAEGELHLGFLYYDMNFYVAKIREEFHKRFPKVKLYLHSYQPKELEDDLLNGKIDAAFIYGAEYSSRRDIDMLPFLKISYTLIYDKTHRFSNLKDLQISDLDGEKLLVPGVQYKINGTHGLMNRMLEKGGAHISEYIEISNFDEVPYLLHDTGAVYLSPMANVNAYGNSTEHRSLLPETYGCDVSMVWKNTNRNPAIPFLRSVVKICFS